MLQEIAIAPGSTSDLFATVEGSTNADGGEVAVWSLSKRAQVGRFAVDWDFGGHRLAVIAEGPVRIITAAYHVHGVSAYGPTGSRLWHRSDLKKVQHITPYFRDGEGRECLGLGAETGSLNIVNSRTGKNWSQLRGAKKLFTGASSARLQLVKGAVKLEPDSQQSHQLKLESFSILDAAFADTAVAISEAGGNLRCFSMSGAPLWEFDFGKGTSHALEVAWNEKHQLWLAVVWNFQKGGPHLLVRINTKGEKVGENNLEPCLGHCLSKAGDIVIIRDGRVSDAITNAVLFRF